MESLSFKQKEIIEKKVNIELKNIYYIQDLKEDDKNKIDVYNIVLTSLENMGFKINTQRKNEMILKFDDIWENGSRVHISIKNDDCSHITDRSSVPYRKSLVNKYNSLLKKCNFDNDECLRSWYILIY